MAIKPEYLAFASDEEYVPLSDKTIRDAIKKDRRTPTAVRPYRKGPDPENDTVRWIKVGNYWECPYCEFGVSEITGTIEGEYEKYTYCPHCGEKVY